jgi:hypothetical protein
MRRAAVIVGLATVLAACSRPAPQTSEADPMAGLVLLTREGCANTETMRAHLDDALRALGRPFDYQVIDQATLARDDPRSGYPTPTLLHRNRDLFGLPVPTPPYLEPT